MLGLGADPDDVVELNDLGEAGVLRQETVTGVDGVGVADLGGRDDVGNVEVGFAGRGRAYADGLVGEADVHGVGIGGGMHCDRLDAHFMAGAMDTQRDLAAVGDPDLMDCHVSSPSRQQRLAYNLPSTGATDRKSTRLNTRHKCASRMPSSG